MWVAMHSRLTGEIHFDFQDSSRFMIATCKRITNVSARLVFFEPYS